MRRVAGLLLAFALAAPGGAGAASFEVGSGATSYSPAGLRVRVGDSITIAASNGHPLVIETEPGGPYESAQNRTPPADGAIPFYCTVHGGPGQQGMSGIVTVGNANAAPTAFFFVSPEQPKAGQPFGLDGVGSTDPERIALTYDWDLGADGTYEVVGGSRNQAVVVDYGGTYAFRLRVRDDLGLTGETVRSVTVDGPPPPSGTAPTLAPTGPGAGPPPSTPIFGPPGAAIPLDRTAPAGVLRATKARGRRLTVAVSSQEDARVGLVLKRGRRLLGRGRGTVRAGRDTTLGVRARTRLKGRLTLEVTLTDAAGNARTLRRSLRA